MGKAAQHVYKETELGLLPANWSVRTIGEICDLATGGTPSRKVPEYWNGNIPWVKTGEVDYTTITETEESISELGLNNSAAKLFPSGTILVAMYGQGVTRGRAAMLGVTAAINQACAALTPKKEVLREFLFFALMAHYQRIRELGHGANQRNLNMQILRGVQMPLPPLSEQQTIARLLSIVQEAKFATEHVLDAAKELRRSVISFLFDYGPVEFSSAEHVELKESEIGEIPATWKTERFDALFESRLGKMLSRASKKGLSPRPYLRNANLQWGRIETDDLYEMDFDEDERNKFRLRHGDVLICEGGEIGRTAIWRDELEECYYQKALHCARPRNDSMLPEFLAYHMMNSFLLSNTYGLVGTKTTIAHLPGVKLKALQLPVPPKAEQVRMITSIQALDEKVELESSRLEAIEQVFESLLHGLVSGQVQVHDIERLDEVAA